MNYLCVCQGGCVRSVALAYVIKYETGRKNKAGRNNAWAVGMDHFLWKPDLNKVQKGAIEFLNHVKHCDVVLTVSESVFRQVEQLLQVFQPDGLIKVIQLNIGEDRWGLKLGPYNSELLQICSDELLRVGIK